MADSLKANAEKIEGFSWCYEVLQAKRWSGGMLVFWAGFHGFEKFCSFKELLWKYGEVQGVYREGLLFGLWSFYRFMKFCWLKDVGATEGRMVFGFS